MENLDELITAAKQFSIVMLLNLIEQLLLNSFLAHTALEAGRTNRNDNDGVQLMTLHAAKGLEFPLVFLCGMEEGLFPHIMSMETEERFRRRAAFMLCWYDPSHAEIILVICRIKAVDTVDVLLLSRFLKEIPQELISSETIS